MFYIAEIGLNHNGDLELAKKMVQAAKEAGADAVKFQSIKAEELVSADTFQTPIDGFGFSDVDNVGDFWEKVSIGRDFQHKIKKFCDNLGVEFMSTPFDFASVDLLDELGVQRYKIASGDLTNYPLIEKILTKHKPLILSTGGSTIQEIKDTVQFINNNSKNPDLTLLHCVSLYPTPPELVNLKAIDAIAKIHNGQVGFSDHTEGFHLALAAIARGAKVIEKHFTLDKSMQGPDHKASLEPDELTRMVQAVRNIEIAMGNGEKKPSASELENKVIVRKSIVAARGIEIGEEFTESNITIKRPGNGISPMQWDKILGNAANKSFKADDLIEL